MCKRKVKFSSHDIEINPFTHPLKNVARKPIWGVVQQFSQQHRR